MTAFAAPTTESAVREAVLDAKAQDVTLRIAAGKTRRDIGRPVQSSIDLDVSNVAGITRYEPGSLTLEAKAGTTIEDISAALETENQMLAFEPMDHRVLLDTKGAPTIGGVVAGNISGPRRFLAGACRDFLLGVRFVDGNGRILKSGGRVMKNVTGLDLTKLSCGAYGTLGVITEVAFKTLPKPEKSATLQFIGLDEAQAVKLFCKATSTPFEVSGAAWQNDVAMLRVEGLSSQVEYRLSKLKSLFKDTPSSVLQGEVHQVLWTGIKDVHCFGGTSDTVWRLSLRPTDAPEVIKAAREHLHAAAMIDQGGAVVWLAIPNGLPEQAIQIRGYIKQGHGYATLVRGSEELRGSISPFQPLAPRLADFSEQLRHQFDPSGLLNPGLMAA